MYDCKEHKTADCPKCFNWAKRVVDMTKRQAKLKNPNVIRVNATREEKLRLLAGIGVELSPTTRLPEEALDRKIRSAIDASQLFAKVIDDPIVDPSSLPLWKGPKSLMESVRRGSIAEAFAIHRAKAEGNLKAPELYVNPWMDVRQTLMSLANNVDQKQSCVIAQDAGNDYAICMRVGFVD